MGANAVTTVPVYVAGEVLTAADLNITNSGIPVFADSTARNAGFGGTGEKVLAEGQFAYLEDTNTTQYYDGSTWQAVGTTPALVLISSTTIGSAVTSVTVSNAFSATYDNYLIIVSGGVASTSVNISLALGASNTGYYSFDIYGDYSLSTVSGFNASNAASINIGVGTTSNLDAQCVVKCPFLSKTTGFVYDYSQHKTSGAPVGSGHAFLNDTTSYTAFTIGRSSGTITGGTIKVYGFQNS